MCVTKTNVIFIFLPEIRKDKSEGKKGQERAMFFFFFFMKTFTKVIYFVNSKNIIRVSHDEGENLFRSRAFVVTGRIFGHFRGGRRK